MQKILTLTYSIKISIPSLLSTAHIVGVQHLLTYHQSEQVRRTLIATSHPNIHTRENRLSFRGFTLCPQKAEHSTKPLYLCQKARFIERKMCGNSHHPMPYTEPHTMLSTLLWGALLKYCCLQICFLLLSCTSSSTRRVILHSCWKIVDRENGKSKHLPKILLEMLEGITIVLVTAAQHVGSLFYPMGTFKTRRFLCFEDVPTRYLKLACGVEKY